MKWLLATLICLSTPVSVIDINDALINQKNTVIEISVDDVHPGMSSTFTYSFNNTTHEVVDIYLISVKSMNDNALTQSMTLKLTQSSEALDVSGLEVNQLITRLNINETYDFNVDFSIYPGTGNVIQTLSETYRFTFGIVRKGEKLANTGHQSKHWEYLIIIGASLILCGYLIKERSEDDEEKSIQ